MSKSKKSFRGTSFLNETPAAAMLRAGRAVPDIVPEAVPETIPKAVPETVPQMTPDIVPKSRKNQQFHVRIKKAELMENIRIYAALEEKSINEFINDELAVCIEKKKKKGGRK